MPASNNYDEHIRAILAAIERANNDPPRSSESTSTASVSETRTASITWEELIGSTNAQEEPTPGPNPAIPIGSNRPPVPPQATRRTECVGCGGIRNCTRRGTGYYCEVCIVNEFPTCATCSAAIDRYYTSHCRRAFTTSPANNAQVRWYCTRCAPSCGAWECRSCGIIYDRSVSVVMANNRPNCSGCAERYRTRADTLLNYTSNVLDYFQARKPPASGIQYGIELEVTTHPDSFNGQLMHVRKTFPDYAICKSDSSINRGGYTGFEIVTIPATVAEHKAEWGKLFATKHRMKSWESGNCGMHIHITRSALTLLQIGKMLRFINDPDNQGLLSRVAGRGSSNYARIFEKSVKDATDHLAASRIFSEKTHVPVYAKVLGRSRTLNHDNHYEALNLQNPKTVELRIFRGNLKPASFFKNLEFTEALVMFCGVASMQSQERPTKDGVFPLSISGFLAFVKQNKQLFPNLVQFLVHHKYMAQVIEAPKDLAAYAKHNKKEFQQEDLASVFDCV